MTITLGTTTLGAISTPGVARRVRPSLGPQTGEDAATALHRLTSWLRGRPGRGQAARGRVAYSSEATGLVIGSDESGPVNHCSAYSTETVWGKVCGCAWC